MPSSVVVLADKDSAPEEIEAAAAGANPEITIVETDEVYRCAVVGRK
jgi:hypothetical protein